MNEIDQLIIAIGYALDAGNPERDIQDRRECREIADNMLMKLIKARRESKDNLANMPSEPGQGTNFTK